MQIERFLIIGLGNPGRSYTRHRHNVGFMVLDELARRQQVAFTRRRGKALQADFRLGSAQVLLAKPQTFMNMSGEAAQRLLRYFHLPLQKTLVVFDDLDLPTAALRMRPLGGSAGHKGMQSVIDRLGSRAIARLRVGGALGGNSLKLDGSTSSEDPRFSFVGCVKLGRIPQRVE